MGLTNEQIEEKKQEIIDFADIGDHIYQPVKTYSSGMFARLAFACAINVDPDILIVDEVLSVGDMAFQLKCFKKFEEFKKKNKTILFVTHSLADIISNCTRTVIIDSGKKIFDGTVKDGVELYKKIITDTNNDKKIKKDESKVKINVVKNKVKGWKDECEQNPDMIEYGNKKAEVIDYGIFDINSNPLKVIDNQSEVVLKSKVIFNEDISDPIFTMTFKNFNGMEICGTNTLIEKVLTGNYKKGEIAEISFSQKIPISPNKYTLSFSCTRFNEKGDLEVLNRKYDALLIEVVATKGCVGLVTLDSKIEVKREKR